MKCVICGKKFIAVRSDAKTCSGACRTKLSRLPDKIQDMEDRVTRILLEFSEYSYIPDVSESVCRSINLIQTMAQHYRQNDSESLWQCQSCGAIERGAFPENKKCACEKSVWALQEKLI